MKAKVKYHIPLRGTKAWEFITATPLAAARDDEADVLQVAKDSYFANFTAG